MKNSTGTSRLDLDYQKCSYQGDRDYNEDCCAHMIVENEMFIVLADGMGGHKGGAQASRAFCDAAVDLFIQSCRKEYEDSRSRLSQIVIDAQQLMAQKLSEDPELDGHTTCVVAVIRSDGIHCAHLGDSRLYVVDSEKIIWRTKDHSLAQLMVAQGELTEEEAVHDKSQAVLFKSVNCKDKPEPSFKTLRPLEPKQVLLTCSDGFWTYLKEEEICSLAKAGRLKERLQELANTSISRANGKADNTTAQVVCLQGQTKKGIKSFLSHYWKSKKYRLTAC